MSLVNDMLRDLDQRRQESTQPKFGAERLVPVASDVGDTKSSRSLLSFVLSIAITLALIIGGLYFWQSLTSVAPQPNLVQPTATSLPVVSTPTSVEQRELEEITLRMQALEAQNRALLEAQSAIATQASATETQLDEEISQPAIPKPIQEPIGVVAIAPLPVATEVMTSPAPQQAADVQPVPSAAVAVVPVTEAPTTEPEAPSAPIRSPRSLNFLERDQLQVQEALSLANSNQNEMAMQQLREFVEANSNAHNSREAMIKLALQKGDSSTAQQLLQNGLSLDPNRAGYRKLQARVLLGAGQAEEAMRFLSANIPTIQDDIEYHDILATAYLSVQDYEKAALSYEALVQQNRGEGRWWYGLASAWDSLGRTRDAGLAYKQALDLPSLSAALRQRSQQRVMDLGL